MTHAHVSRDQKVALAWERGLLAWKLDKNQLGMRDFFLENLTKSKKHVWNCSRQLGKSWLACIIAVEFALRNPNAQIKYAAQTGKQVKKIVRPHFRMIFADCPKELRPTFHTQEGEYRFHNGSTITVAGCDRDNAETLRGQHAHLAIVDEAGGISDLKYVVDDILLPQTLNTRGYILIISTPGKSSGHPFKAFCDRSQDDGTFLKRTIYDNPRLTDREIEEMCRESGGAESTTWRREYLVEHVTDEDAAVLPEATEYRMRESVIKINPANPRSYRPQFFDTYVFLDLGWSPDYTGIIWAIWDHSRATLIAEKDFIGRKIETHVLAAVLRGTWDDLWGKGHKPYLCIGDVDDRTLSTLARDHNIYFVKPDKENKDAAISDVRLMVKGTKYKLETHPDVKALRRQMMNAIWNKQKTKFERTDLDGHFDLVDALIYGRRHFHPQRDPTPEGYGYDPKTQLMTPGASQESSLVRALKHSFGIGR